MGCGGVVSTPAITSTPTPMTVPKSAQSMNTPSQPHFMYANGHSKSEQEMKVKIRDGTVSSPYPPEYNIPKDINFWQFISHYIKSVVGSKNGHLEWIVDATPHNKSRLRYTELETKSSRLASGLYKLGLRPRQAVVMFSRNLTQVHLLYFALWRMNAVVWVAGIGSNSEQLIDQIDGSGALFLLCDKETELPALEAMKKRKIIILSVKKLRQSTSIDIIDLLNGDDGRDCPSQVPFDQDDVILITKNGSSHTHKSLITGAIQGGILRTTTTSTLVQLVPTKCFFYPVNEGHCELATILWPIATLMIGKTLIMMDRPTSQTVVVTLREFSVGTICGCPEFIQSVSKHIAEQGGSMPSVTSLILKSSSSMSFSERILRKGFPNIKSIDILYGLEECLFVTSTIKNNNNNNTYTNGSLLHPHSVGYLCSYTIGKVVDLDTGVRLSYGETGELCFKTEACMRHYTDKVGVVNRKTIIDGWIHSGDFGYFDSTGTFYVLGRVAEVFQYYADYISPRELEHVILSHPDVLNCAVIGIPESMAGHLPCAIIVRRAGSQVSGKEIRTFVNSRVSNYKQLRGGILFLDQLPSCKDVVSLRRKLLEHVQKVYSNKSWID